MREQRWLGACLRRAGMETAELRFHVAGNGRVRRIELLGSDASPAAAARCLQLATLIELDREGCRWSAHWRVEPALVLEIATGE